MRADPHWRSPNVHLVRTQPDLAEIYFYPTILQDTYRAFRRGFAGLVTYAVKANDRPEVLDNLVAAGMRAFDVASVAEMHAVRAACDTAVLHYNNPVRSHREIEQAVALNVASYSIDCPTELDKLIQGGVRDAEISVRLALPVAGAAYDFGEKFGVDAARAAVLLRRVVDAGLTPAITFHPGTQCEDPAAWGVYIQTAADVARQAGVQLARLNVGGGFAAHRAGQAPDLARVFDIIEQETQAAFGDVVPALVCEPGRAMVADAFSLATRVKALRGDGSVFLNDGIYGGLSELRDIGPNERIEVISAAGNPRMGAVRPRVAFGPTCDSLDRVPVPLPLPGDVQEGDYVLFHGMGAYSLAISTGFNGYGLGDPVTVAAPSGNLCLLG